MFIIPERTELNSQTIKAGKWGKTNYQFNKHLSFVIKTISYQEQLDMTVYNADEPDTELTLTRRNRLRKIIPIVVVNVAVVTYFVFATLNYIDRSIYD